MQRVVNSVLVADGRSVRVLVQFIDRLMAIHCPCLFRATDFVDDYPEAVTGLAQRVLHALRQYPADIVFVHRDAELRDAVSQREQEIAAAVATLPTPKPVIAIVPVRMTEAWLLTDEQAIRKAAGNPHGTALLALPALHQIEAIDAKARLFEALRSAKNLGKRRTGKLHPEQLRHRVADHLDDFTTLRSLPSFARFEAAVQGLFQSPAFIHA